MITPAATPPTEPAQGGVLDSAWYRETAPADHRSHQSEMTAAHGCVPSPEAAVAMGVTAPPCWGLI
jgi:hypothetical protein